ncbi:hypothetical protein ACB092_12G080500 [Castanea dentata]
MVHLFVGNFLPALKNKPKTEVQYQYQQNTNKIMYEINTSVWRSGGKAPISVVISYLLKLCHKLRAHPSEFVLSKESKIPNAVGSLTKIISSTNTADNLIQQKTSWSQRQTG